jgi:hypothetical protein
MTSWTGPRRQCCPCCARDPKDKTLVVALRAGGGTAICHRCQHMDTLPAGEARRLIAEFNRAKPATRQGATVAEEP